MKRIPMGGEGGIDPIRKREEEEILTEALLLKGERKKKIGGKEKELPFGGREWMPVG